MYRLPALFFSMLVSSSLAAQSFFTEKFIDPDDGWVDGGNFLLDYPYGVLPVPIVITEPAVGEGLGVAAVYFHDADPAWEGARVDSKGRTPPRSVSAVAAAATNNDSEILGGGHFGHYRKDTIRYEGLAGGADLNLKFYGLGSGPENSDGFQFNTDALFISQQLAFRLGESDWFVGAEYLYTDVDIEFKTGIDIPGLDSGTFNSKNAAAGALLIYDSLSNNYSPASGIQSEIAYQRYDEKVGGDFNYDVLQLKNQVHFTPMDRLAIGLRLDASFADGDIPFYALPYIELRGIPALRYQGDNVVTGEFQAAWAVHPRIQLLGFIGAGQAVQDRDDLGDANTEVAGGFGVRYMFVKLLGMSVGLDYAKGPEDSTVYISFGTKF
jgi:hypothetical protein